MQCETFTQKCKKISDMYWALHEKIDYAQNLRKSPMKANKTTFRIFQSSERNLVMHFQKTENICIS